MAATPSNTGVRTQHPDYIELKPKWERCSDVVDGQDAVHKAGEKYLPKLIDEEPKAYAARLKRSDFFNATWRTIAGLSGMAFRKSPVVVVPAGIEPYLADIDMAGCSLDDLAKHMVEDALEYGPFGLMVDYPPMPEAPGGNVVQMSVKTAEDMGMRPLIQYYDIESVRNWRYARVNNKKTLVLVVLDEEAPVHDDEYSHKTEPRYRRLDLDPMGFYRQTLWRVNDKNEDEQVGGDVYPLMNGKPMTTIPFRIVGEVDEPPLIDLVDANIAHYQVNSDYRHGLHFTALPTLFLAGVVMDADKKFSIGSAAAVTADNPDAKAQFIEFTGQGLQPMETALKSLEQRMAILGARMIADETKQAETLGATQIKRSGENSILADIVIGVSEAIEWALGIFCEWAGKTGEISYQINREFTPAGMDANQLTALLKGVQAGKISDIEFFELLQKADLVAADKSFEQHQEETATTEPVRPTAPAANDPTGGIAA